MTWRGLEELKAALRALPAELRDDAEPIVAAAGQQAIADIRSRYPTPSKTLYSTGRLYAGLYINKMTPSQYGVRYRVGNSAPHARLFERGTRKRTNRRGANRGTMPAANIFYPAIKRAKDAMYQRLAQMLRQHGLTVTGS